MKKKKLIAFDLEGTLSYIQAYSGSKHEYVSIWPIIADEIGATEEENKVNKMWKEKKFDTYIAYMEATIKVHKEYGLTEKTFNGILDKIPWIECIPDTFDRLKAKGYSIIIVSGGFKNQAERLPYPPDDIFAGCNYIFKNGKLDSWELIESDWKGKINFLEMKRKELGLNIDDCWFVGDGKNDVGIAQYCSNSIALNACEELSRVTRHCADTDNLLDILPFL